MVADPTTAQLRAENAALRQRISALESATADRSSRAPRRVDEPTEAIAEAILAQLFDLIPVSMAILRLTDHRLIKANPRFLQTLHLPDDAANGDSSTNFGFWVNPSVYQNLLRQLQTQDVVSNVSARMRSGTGEFIDVQVTALLTTYEMQAGVLLMFEDVTSKVGLETQVRHSHRMEALGTFAAGIAHDFNNVLGVMLGYADLTLYDVPQGSVGWRNLQEILQAGRRAKDLVQQILSFSRRDVQTEHPALLSDLVQEVIKFLRAFLPATIAIRHELPTDIGLVAIEPTQLHQVVMNLCTNAEYAMRSQGGLLSITAVVVVLNEPIPPPLSVLQPGPYVRLSICDTGDGMPAEVAERIFEPHFTTKTDDDGSGMGLAVSNSIITDYGGTIAVQSTPGVGTTFDVYLPRYHGEVNAPTVLPDQTIPTGRGSILFVDDEVMLADLGYRLLSRLGYAVTIYTDSGEALNAFRQQPDRFDLVITDQTMPHMTGADLVKELRHIRPDIPVILCTGFSHLMDAERAQELGVDAFLMKPLELPELAVAIHQAMTQSPS